MGPVAGMSQRPRLVQFRPTVELGMQPTAARATMSAAAAAASRYPDQAMLSFDDPTWTTLAGGRGRVIDIRPLLTRLEVEPAPESAWEALWDALHHQGDIGIASFAAVPHLVRIHRQRGTPDWNTYALVATIELARDGTQNPELPDWARPDYEAALRELVVIGLGELPRAQAPEAVLSILSVAAIAHGQRVHGRALLEFDSEELQEILDSYEAG